MFIQFVKYEGAGNDFIMISGLPFLTKHQISKLCHRKFGIGADGVIFVNRKSNFEIEMYYYNSDGSYASFCGNGARCAAQFAFTLGGLEKKGILTVENKPHEFEIYDNGLVVIQLNNPNNIESNFKLSNIDYNLSFVNTGVEHVVIDCSNLPFEEFNSFNITSLGSKIRYHKRFSPNGTNVNFYWKNDNQFLVRTYERGVEAETLACGTGTTATAYIDMMKSNNFEDRYITTKSKVVLKVSYKDNSLFLLGPTTMVFSGNLQV